MQRVKKLNLGSVSIKTLPGLTDEDRSELRLLQVGSVQALMDHADAQDGDFTSLSTSAVVIDADQSERIGQALLEHPRIPDAWKKGWKPTTAADQTPADAARQGQKENDNGFVQFWKKYW